MPRRHQRAICNLYINSCYIFYVALQMLIIIYQHLQTFINILERSIQVRIQATYLKYPE